MKQLFWILGGALLVSAAFFIPEGAGQVWQSLLLSGIAVLFFLITYVFFQPKNSAPNKNIAGVATGILLVLVGIHGWLGYQESIKQSENLVEIRKVIESGIAKNHINEMLLTTLRSYYSSEKDDANLGALFKFHHDSLMNDTEIKFYPSDEERSPKIELVKATADSVVIVAYSSFVSGRSTAFKNYDGQNGYLQTKGILTTEGIEYEREN
jgi:hypothetical protein